MYLLSIHPAAQSAAILLALYALLLGIQRFRSRHLGHPSPFQWKRHVILGTLCLGTMLGGIGAGLFMVHRTWHRILITGLHGKTALLLIPFLIFGLVSGIILNNAKSRQKILPLLHAGNNLLVVIILFFQAYTGYWVFRNYILGM